MKLIYLNSKQLLVFAERVYETNHTGINVWQWRDKNRTVKLLCRMSRGNEHPLRIILQYGDILQTVTHSFLLRHPSETAIWVIDPKDSEIRDVPYLDLLPAPEQIAAYIANKGTKCLICESIDLEHGEMEIPYQEVECEHCGYQWTDNYSLTGVITKSQPEEDQEDSHA